MFVLSVIVNTLILFVKYQKYLSFSLEYLKYLSFSLEYLKYLSFSLEYLKYLSFSLEYLKYLSQLTVLWKEFVQNTSTIQLNVTLVNLKKKCLKKRQKPKRTVRESPAYRIQMFHPVKIVRSYEISMSISTFKML